MNNEEKDNYDELIDNAIEQSNALQEKRLESNKFNALSKTEQNIQLFKELRKKNPIKRDLEIISVIPALNLKCFAQTKNKTTFEGIYIKADCNESKVYYTNKGFLRLIKSNLIEIDVITNKALK
jgi:glutamate/tyrosine decarboxylase-like PLP-dependent enzyme